jgi:hypothetical protein
LQSAPQALLGGAAKLGLAGLTQVAPEVGATVSDLGARMDQTMQMRRTPTDVNAQLGGVKKDVAATLAEQGKLGLTTDEQAASTLLRQGEAQSLAPLANLPPDQLAQVTKPIYPQPAEGQPITTGSGAVTPGALRTALDVQAGTADPALVARLEQNAQISAARQTDPRQMKALLGEGLVGGPLASEHFGTQPLPEDLQKPGLPANLREA